MTPMIRAAIYPAAGGGARLGSGKTLSREGS